MAEKATEFLLTLSTDPRALETFKADPQKAVENAGLSPAEQTLVLSGNPSLIQKALVRDTGFIDAARAAGAFDAAAAAADTVVVVVVVVVV